MHVFHFADSEVSLPSTSTMNIRSNNVQQANNAAPNTSAVATNNGSTASAALKATKPSLDSDEYDSDYDTNTKKLS